MGSDDKGARSETEDIVRLITVRVGICGGDDVRSKPNDDVGTGVGYLLRPSSCWGGLCLCRFAGGSFGGEEGKSNAGRSGSGAGLFVPAAILSRRETCGGVSMVENTFNEV